GGAVAGRRGPEPLPGGGGAGAGPDRPGDGDRSGDGGHRRDVPPAVQRLVGWPWSPVMTSLARVPAGNAAPHRLLRPGARTASGALAGGAGCGTSMVSVAVGG